MHNKTKTFMIVLIQQQDKSALIDTDIEIFEKEKINHN